METVPLPWRVAFLTTSTWECCTATDAELDYALSAYRPQQSPEAAVAMLKFRRAQAARGLLKIKDKEPKEVL